MKMRNKGKVHPCSSSSSSSTTTDSLSVLNLLPAVILTLISVLSFEEREVLAYMITKSLKSEESKKRGSKKECCGSNVGRKSPPLFDCDCFHCYTSFWVRWDSSPNRELIHQAIEAFEEHLNNGENFKKTPVKNKRKEKMGRGRKVEKVSSDGGSGGGALDFPAVGSPEKEVRVVVVPESEVVEEEVVPPRPIAAAPAVVPESEVVEEEVVPPRPIAAAPAVVPPRPVAAAPAVVRAHKGLARKVLPDVMGVFSSRLWSLWNPEG